jgi:hypothetical protein
VRRSEVDRDAPLRELKARVQQCRLDALARLAHGGVGAADDREGRQPAAQVNLDGHLPRGEAVDREGRDVGEHRPHARDRRVPEQHTSATSQRKVCARILRQQRRHMSCSKLLQLRGDMTHAAA